MSKAGAGLAAAGPLWHAFIKQAYSLKTDCDTAIANAFCLPKNIEQFTKPDPIQTTKSMLNGSYLSTQTVKIDKISGALATNQTPPDLIEEKTVQSTHSVLYSVNKDDPQGAWPTSPSDDPQYNNWEAAAQNWLASHGLSVAGQILPGQTDQLHTLANLPKIQIIYPSGSQTITQSKMSIQTNITAPLGVKQVDFFINNVFVGSTMAAPYQIDYTIPSSVQNGQADLMVRAYDQAFNRQEEKITIYINR
ncbi:MAG: hypothetical protein UW11_C0022G0025 [Parcubacteria group bacterium GW2011_GWA2_43_9b]|nr:MAG: hypothetical protein UW11_C0022G0025 [Parcubacteria group bacterium GW2011_GWA2_43_9b]